MSQIHGPWAHVHDLIPSSLGHAVWIYGYRVFFVCVKLCLLNFGARRLNYTIQMDYRNKSGRDGKDGKNVLLAWLKKGGEKKGNHRGAEAFSPKA
jgi:hypothetical protein